MKFQLRIDGQEVAWPMAYQEAANWQLILAAKFGKPVRLTPACFSVSWGVN